MKLKKEDLDRVLETLSKEATVLVPTRDGDTGKFVPWQPGTACELELGNTKLPPKDALFPQTEKMFCYRQNADGQGLSVQEYTEVRPQVVFGIRPCDVASIGCMDLVFLTKTFVDSFYARKREHTTLIALACTEAEETCFCTSMGGGPSEAPLADLLLTPTESGWNVSVQSEKGSAIVKLLGPLLQDGEDPVLPAAEPTLRPDMEGVPQKLRELFDHPMWEEVYRPCLTCGTCTFLCPTCFCFEIGTEAQGSEGVQERFWDSCMFSEYTRMAGGHNPRPSNKERVRNRYMHKLSWFEERYGQHLCVGCGRCIAGCPVGMDITHIIDLAQEVEPVCNSK